MFKEHKCFASAVEQIVWGWEEKVGEGERSAVFPRCFGKQMEVGDKPR